MTDMSQPRTSVQAAKTQRYKQKVSNTVERWLKRTPDNEEGLGWCIEATRENLSKLSSANATL